MAEQEIGFIFSDEAKRANGLSVGLSYQEQTRLPMDMLGDKIKPSVCESSRQVTPRGTLYLQMNRKASMAAIREIIEKF